MISPAASSPLSQSYADVLSFDSISLEEPPTYSADPPFQSDSREEPPKKRRRLNNDIHINALPSEMRFEIFRYAGEDPNVLRTIRSVCTLWHDELDGLLEIHWEQMRGERFPSLHPLTSFIDKKAGDSKQLYFSRFCGLTRALRAMGAPIPKKIPVLALQPLRYAMIKKDLDDSLVTIWSRIQPGIDFGQESPPVGAEEIRKWLNQEASKVRITRITRLNLSQLELKIVPVEIGLFTQLTHLDLSNNNLTSIPAMHHLTLMKKILLSENPLTSPLNTLCKLPSYAGFVL